MTKRLLLFSISSICKENAMHLDIFTDDEYRKFINPFCLVCRLPVLLLLFLCVLFVVVLLFDFMVFWENMKCMC